MDGVRTDFTAGDESERARILSELGQPRYRARQLEKWVFRRAADFQGMTDFPSALREQLAARFYIPRPQMDASYVDGDGTTRYLFRLADGAAVEAVYIPDADHDAACLSSQAGCALGCRFCATGAIGFRSNLSAYEITATFALLQADRPDTRVRNVVFMGQGEPLLNFDAVVGAINNLAGHFEIGARRVTVSTAGLADKIRLWADVGPPVKLAISLNSAVQKTRDILMPGVSRWRLEDLALSCEYYWRTTRRRVTFEYVLLAAVNDDAAHARALLAFSRRIPCKINLIPFNPWPGAPFQAPDGATIEKFQAKMMEGPMAVMLRRPRGVTVNAACGTLANAAGERHAAYVL